MLTVQWFIVYSTRLMFFSISEHVDEQYKTLGGKRSVQNDGIMIPGVIVSSCFPQTKSHLGKFYLHPLYIIFTCFYPPAISNLKLLINWKLIKSLNTCGPWSCWNIGRWHDRGFVCHTRSLRCICRRDPGVWNSTK